MLNLYKLEIFTLVAERGSLSQAAEALYMSHASVSQHIRELEASLGVKLFERGRRGVTLTETGELFYRRAQELLRLAAEIESEVTNVEQVEAELRLGATPGVGAYLMPEWLNRFRGSYPQIEVVLQTATTAEISAGVADRMVHLAFTEGEPDVEGDRVRVTPIYAVEQFVVVGQGHPWWDHEQIELADLNERQMISRQNGSHTRNWLDGILDAQQIKVQVMAAFDGLEAIKRSVMLSGTCFTVLPEYTFQQEAQIGQLKGLHIADMPLERSMWLVQHGQRPLVPAARAFLRTLADDHPNVRMVL